MYLYLREINVLSVCLSVCLSIVNLSKVTAYTLDLRVLDPPKNIDFDKFYTVCLQFYKLSYGSIGGLTEAFIIKLYLLPLKYMYNKFMHRR